MKQIDALIKSQVETVSSKTSKQIAAGIHLKEVLAHMRLLNQIKSTFDGLFQMKFSDFRRQKVTKHERIKMPKVKNT